MIIGIGELWENSANRKIRESLLGISGVVIFPGTSNQCTLVLDNQQAGRYYLATELEIIRFRPFPFRYLVWHLRTQVNNSLLDDYITEFEPKRGKRRCFIPFLVYALFYLSIYSKIVKLDNLSTWYESVCTHTCSTFSRNPLLRLYRTVETRILLNC